MMRQNTGGIGLQVFGTRLFHLKKDARQAVGLLWTARRRHGAVWLVLRCESLRTPRTGLVRGPEIEKYMYLTPYLQE